MSMIGIGWRAASFGSAASLAFAFATGPALAGPTAAGPADTDGLRAQVDALTKLVQSISDRDQRQIESLSAEVRVLQTRLEAQEVSRIADQRTAPRASQNATAQFATPTTQVTAGSTTAEPRVVQNSSHRLAFQSADGGYSIGFTGDIQFDSGGVVDFHPDSKLVGPQKLSDGANARRARIGVTGTAAGNWGFALVYDAGNSQDTVPKGIETAQIIYSGLSGAAVELGYSNTFFTLDQSTSSNDTLFLERSTPSNIATSFNAGDARTNAGLRFFGDRYWAGAYITGPASGDSHTLTAERFGAFERIALQALKGNEYSVHLGVGLDQLLQAANSGTGTANTLALSDQPELRIDPTTFANTGPIGTLANPVTGGSVLDFETAATYRNLFWQGEYYSYQVDRRGLRRNIFDGWYGQIGWTLTGETRVYNPQAASYFRISPTNPFTFTHGGWGAWELAARVSFIDLNSDFNPGAALSTQPEAVDGGLQRAYSLVLNWYPNDVVRFLLDYSHVDYEKANSAAVKGVLLATPVGSRFDSIALRAQVAY